eukprot:1052366-Prorocentrum_minimum.AAC.3
MPVASTEPPIMSTELPTTSTEPPMPLIPRTVRNVYQTKPLVTSTQSSVPSVLTPSRLPVPCDCTRRGAR